MLRACRRACLGVHRPPRHPKRGVMHNPTDVAVCIRVLRDLSAYQCWKSHDDAKSEWSYVAEKDCPATGVAEPGRHLHPCPPLPPRVARGDRAQRLPGFDAPAMTRG